MVQMVLNTSPPSQCMEFFIEWKSNEPANRPIGLHLKRYNCVAGVNHGKVSLIPLRFISMGKKNSTNNLD